MELLDRLTDRLDAELQRLPGSGCRTGLLLAVSGGPDSTALALAAARLARRKRESGRLVVGYVDHRLGRESLRAGEAVADLARSLGLEFRERALAEKGGGLSEDRLRRLRYTALLALARTENLRWVLTAHHRDDDLEGLVMRLRRGAGPRGLRGMPSRRPLAPDTWLVRPFLGVRRDLLERVVVAAGVPVRRDPANVDLQRTRNRTRHVLLPRLRAVWVGMETDLDGLRCDAQTAYAALEDAAHRLLRRRGRRPAPWRVELSVSPAEAVRWRPALQEALRVVHERLRPNEPAPWNWVERAADLCGAPTAARVHGPGKLLVERTREGLLVVDPGRAGRVRPRVVPLDGRHRRLGDSEWHLAAGFIPAAGALSRRERSRRRVQLDAEHVRLPLRVRPPRPGDRFHPLGAARDVELRRFLQSRRVARWDRDRLPLVVDAEDRIVWICGVEVCEACRVRENTRTRLALEAHCGIAGVAPEGRPYFSEKAGSSVVADP